MQVQNLLESPRFDALKAHKVQVVKSDQLAVDGLFVAAGKAYGPHRLPNADREVSCLSGSGELVIHTETVDQRIALEPGAVVLAPRNAWHAVVAKTDLVVTVANPFPARVEERG
jgi:quercetin dioxygenase-like cupin family protein